MATRNAKGNLIRRRDEVVAPAAPLNPYANYGNNSYQVTQADLDGGVVGLSEANGITSNQFLAANPGVTRLSRGQYVTIPRLGSAMQIFQTGENERMTVNGTRIGPNSILNFKKKMQPYSLWDRLTGKPDPNNPVEPSGATSIRGATQGGFKNASPARGGIGQVGGAAGVGAYYQPDPFFSQAPVNRLRSQREFSGTVGGQGGSVKPPTPSGTGPPALYSQLAAGEVQQRIQSIDAAFTAYENSVRLTGLDPATGLPRPESLKLLPPRITTSDMIVAGQDANFMQSRGYTYAGGGIWVAPGQPGNTAPQAQSGPIRVGRQTFQTQQAYNTWARRQRRGVEPVAAEVPDPLNAAGTPVSVLNIRLSSG